MKIQFCKEWALTDYVYLTRVDGSLITGSISTMEDTARGLFNQILANRGKLPDTQNIVLETHIILPNQESDTEKPQIENVSAVTP